MAILSLGTLERRERERESVCVFVRISIFSLFVFWNILGGIGNDKLIFLSIQ